MLVSILLFVLFGFVVGLVAKLFVGGPGGFFETAGLGMAGALIGGLIASGAGWASGPGWSFPGFVSAVIGSILLIVIARAVRGAAV